MQKNRTHRYTKTQQCVEAGLLPLLGNRIIASKQCGKNGRMVRGGMTRQPI
ncbi:hypothetical protein EZS27_007070 [termite gut metagenome]|uniref:Uncharacterized protein n=1 Tax=termite gut metagenome TaxID=433724 RepID=A0A5J4SJ87_9ZZZZ